MNKTIQFICHCCGKVITKSGNDKPEIFPHKDANHPFVIDFYNGITKEEAEKRIREIL